MNEVSVIRSPSGSHAQCGCGYTGKTRVLNAFPVNDAHTHASQTGHEPRQPLVGAA